MTKFRRRYAVVTVYDNDDGFEPLVHVKEVYSTPSAAMKRANEMTRLIVEDYNSQLSYRRKKAPDEAKPLFDPLSAKDLWEKVDNGERDWAFKDWGFDSIDHCFDVRIRVVSWDEPVKKGKAK